MFRAAADPARARNQKAYLMSDLHFFGCPQAVIRGAARDFGKAHPDLTHARLVALVRALWRTDSFELRSAGIAILERRVALLTSRDLPLVERMIRASRTWAHVDWIAARIVRDLVARNRRLKTVMRRWARDESFWIRRSALLALRDDFPLFAALAEPMLEEREFFIRKAIGWILRDVSKDRPGLVDAFLTRHIGAVSGLTLREGAKYLPARRRAALLAEYARR